MSDPARRGSYFLYLALAITSVVFLGFWFTYFSPLLAGQYPRVSPAVHLHGWTFFGWYLLLPLQAGLIRLRRPQWHALLGASSLVLATAMVLTGLVVLGVRMKEAAAAPAPSFFSLFGPGVFSTLLLFAVFYVAAFALRRRPGWHKRLVIVASVGGMGAATFRIASVLSGNAARSVPVGVLATNLFLAAAMTCDLRRDGRVHPAWWIGLAACLAVEAGLLVATWPPGVVVARALAWVGQVLGFLY